VFDLLVREALHSPFDEAKYSAYLDGLIEILNEMAAPRMVPGRIYGDFVLSGFQKLTAELLAILAGNLPPDGDEGVLDLIQRLLDGHPKFRAEKTLRDFEYQFGGYATALDGAPDQRFTATIKCFITDPDLAALRARLKAIFVGVVALVAQSRLRWIREAPLDMARLKAVRDAVQSALLADTRPGGAFLPIILSRTDRALEARRHTFGRMDRGSFTLPEMSGITFDELPAIFIEWARSFFHALMWQELSHRPKAIERFDVQLGAAALLKRVEEMTGEQELGDELILLVPYNPFGEPIQMAASGFRTEGLEGYGLTREAGAESGIGCNYVGTLGKIHIYSWQHPDGILCSRTLLRAARFGRVHDLDAHFDFQLHDAGDPTQSMVDMWLATEFEWEDRRFVEFRFDSANRPAEGNKNPAV
jgi:hypothetical protein